MSYVSMGVQGAFQSLQVGVLRTPCYIAAALGAAAAGQAVLRVMRETLNAIGLYNPDNFVAQTADKVYNWAGQWNIIDPVASKGQNNPVRETSLKTLAFRAAFWSTAGVIGIELVNLAFGQPPALYNKVLTWLGPVRLDTQHHHPLVQMGIDFVSARMARH